MTPLVITRQRVWNVQGRRLLPYLCFHRAYSLLCKGAGLVGLARWSRVSGVRCRV